MRSGGTPNFARTAVGIANLPALAVDLHDAAVRTTHCARSLSGVQMQTFSTRGSAAARRAADASASSASSSTIAQTVTPMAVSASSSGWNCRQSARSMPSPVLYPGQSSLRKDSMTWSVATPRCVAPPSSICSTVWSTPATAPMGGSVFPSLPARPRRIP